MKHEVKGSLSTAVATSRGDVLCWRCPVALSGQALSDQAVVLLAPLYACHKGESHRPRGRAFVVMEAVFAALPECRGLCFRCALERARPPNGAEHLVGVSYRGVHFAMAKEEVPT